MGQSTVLSFMYDISWMAFDGRVYAVVGTCMQHALIYHGGTHHDGDLGADAVVQHVLRLDRVAPASQFG